MKKNIILNLLLCCLALPAAAGQQISGKVKVNGTDRSYIGYLPTKLGELRPMLISCHGMNQDAPYQKNMLSIESVADTAKFLTIFPQGEGNSWDISGDKDINFVVALIDEMEKKYKIDRGSVYLSGFSMGGMFTYHAMNKIPDKIAAFAPISGYSMWGTSADANVRPLPIIHTHGTGDDVVNFSGVQGALDVWIKHNGCPTKAKVEKNYRKASHITRHTWGPGKEGVEVVLMEMADKGHWISNDNGVKTGDEIWRFCKRFSLVQRNPTVKYTSDVASHNYVTLGGATELPPIKLETSASDPDGQVVSVSYYDGTKLLATVNEAPYTFELTGLKKGTHEIKAVATDDEGRTGTTSFTIKITEPVSTGYYALCSTLKNYEGGIPEAWCTFDGNMKHEEETTGYSSGGRVIHLTNTKRDFEWGLYTRNVTGKAKDGYARFAAADTKTTLTLKPGHYKLVYKVANWNKPSFSPVTVAIETMDGKEVCSETYTPTSNIGNKADNAFSGTKARSYEFDIYEEAHYMITFYTDDSSWADLMLGQANLYYVSATTGVAPVGQPVPVQTRYYNLQGQHIDKPTKGVYIIQTVAADGTRKSRVVRE